jgi:D-xylose transport system substrate-binding protein
MSLRNILVVVSLVLSVVIGLVMAKGSGSAVGGAAREKPRIGLSLDTLKEARWKADRDLFVKRAGELGAEVLDQSANSDDTVQVSNVEGLISRGVDVMVIVPHDGLAMAKAVEACHAAKIPVIAYDRIIKNCDLDLYLSFDNEKVGELQGKYVVDHLPGGKGKIIRIYGAKTDNNAFQFKAGQDKVLKPYIERGDIQVIHEDWAEDWKPENAKRIVNAAITSKGKDFQAVLASNDGTAGGAVQALMEEGLAGKVMVTGQDAELVACQRIVNGTQAMTVYKPLKKLATTAAEVAAKIANRGIVVANQTVNNGKVNVPSILGEVVTVTKENMKETVIADGFQKEEDVYRGVAQ